jgi:alpha-beta hydrolase superfamily lysophospholipase
MLADTVPLVRAPVSRACYLRVGDRFLFTWHHPARPEARRGAAAVLCPPLGFDYICAYRSWRILAERLACLGFDVLRFDYDGTGDSEGGAEDPDRLDAWLGSIARTVREAQEITGSRDVALVGLGLGATLAMQATAAIGGVSRLVLWSPFSSGRAYVRELRAFALLGRRESDPSGRSENGDILAAGHLFTRSTVDALEQLDLRRHTIRPAREVLLIDRDQGSVDPQLRSHLEGMGSRVTRYRPAGTADLLVQPALSKPPELAFKAITNWLGGWHPSRRGPAGSKTEAADEALQAAGGYLERAVRFGPGRRLFGILTTPASGKPSAPSVIFLTTGSEYHVGPNRLYVPLARSWAAEGHLVLRYDLGGIGDSLPPPGAEENVPYPEYALDDAREAIAMVRKEAPNRRLIVIGLCSGGWLAFRAALDGLGVDAIVSINPPLYLRDGSSGVQYAVEGSEFERYQQCMQDPARWVKVLRGRAAYQTFIRLCWASVRRQVLIRVNGALGHRLFDDLRRDLEAISDRGITSLFVFSRGDRGLSYFRLHGGAARCSRIKAENCRYVVVDGADHTFQPLTAQRTLRDMLVGFVASQSATDIGWVSSPRS